MTRMFLQIGGYEAGILWRFLDGVSAAVSSRMVGGSSPTEDNLTFLLCELLDANTTSLHALSYPLAQAQADLEASDAGITLEVEFQTHEHSKHVESKYSSADLGIVLSVNHPVFGQSRRGILIQAKRLFTSGKNRDFGLHSAYSSFAKTQADFLKILEGRFSVYNSIYYLWYNPPSTAFPDVDAKILRAYESSGGSRYQYWHKLHPFLIDELLEMGLPWFLVGGGLRTPSLDEEEKARRWRSTQPALRLSALDVALDLGEHGPPQLKALYDATLERRSVAFSPFADFLLLALTNSNYGSSNTDWLRLTEGQKVPMPPPKQANQRIAEIDELDSSPIPRHTLRVSVRSTLPQVG